MTEAFTITILALALLYSSPAATKMLSAASSTRDITFAFVSLLVSATVFSVVPKLPKITLTDIVVGASLCYG